MTPFDSCVDRRGRTDARYGRAKVHHQPSSNSQPSDSYTTIHYYRELGPTAIAPGHKRISIKVQQQQQQQQQQHHGSPFSDPSAPASHSTAYIQPLTSVVEEPGSGDYPPLFDSETGLPVAKLLPDLLDAFFEYYADNFCFLNRCYLNQLLDRGEASVFLLCSMAALSSRFCNPAKFSSHFPPKEDGSQREGWELSNPFLERAKSLLMPLLGIPSCDVVGSMVMLSLAEFGNNSESGKSLLGLIVELAF